MTYTFQQRSTDPNFQDADETSLFAKTDGLIYRQNQGNPAEPLGNMDTSIYDPQGIMDDAFDTDNHTEGLVNTTLTIEEKNKYNNITNNGALPSDFVKSTDTLLANRSNTNYFMTGQQLEDYIITRFSTDRVIVRSEADFPAPPSGNITSVSNAGGGRVTITIDTTLPAAFATNEWVELSGTDGAAYDGVYEEVFNVTVNTFDIDATFSGTASGSWKTRIELELEKVYVLEDTITMTTPLLWSPVNSINSNNPAANVLLWFNSGTFIKGTQSGVNVFFLKNCVIASPFGRIFNVKTASGVPFASALLQNMTYVDTPDVGILDGFPIIAMPVVFGLNCGDGFKIKNVGLISIVTNVLGASTALVKKDGVSGTANSFTDLGGGSVRVGYTRTSSTNVEPQLGEEVRIQNTGSVNYDSIFRITAVGTGTFDISATFDGNLSGDFDIVSGTFSGNGGTFFSFLESVNEISILGCTNTPAHDDNFLFIDPAIDLGTFNCASSPFDSRLGGNFFKAGTTGTILNFSASGINTNVESTAHGLTTGDTLFIFDSGVDAYDAGHVITVVDVNNFTIPVAFTTNPATGTWDTGSLIESNPKVNVSDDCGNQKASSVSGSLYVDVSGTPEVLTVTTAGVYVDITSTNWLDRNLERFKDLGDGQLEYIGENPSIILVNGGATVEKVGGGSDQLGIALFFYDSSDVSPAYTIVDGTVSVTQNTTPANIKVMETKLLFEKGDRVRCRLANLTGTSDINLYLSGISA